MKITENKVVSLSYELKTTSDGDIIEKVDNNNPLVFIFGAGTMLPKFEQNIAGLAVGEKFDFKLDFEDAYGAYTQEAVVEVPKDAFKVNGALDDNLLVINNIIPLQDNYGNRFNGKVIKISNENVTMDLNHPLADQDLYFKGEIVEIREASKEELEHGHTHHHHHDHEHKEDHECSNCGCGGH